MSLFFKTRGEGKEFGSIVNESESLQGLYDVSFHLNPGKVQVKIYESTRVLHRVEQTHRTNSRIPILLMNSLTEGTT